MQKQYKPALKLAVVAATLFSGAAMAQSSVTLYGQADMFVGGVKSPGSGERAWVANSGGMQTSYWGIKGTEDLGGGTKAIFDLNGFFRTDSGNSGRFNGDSMFSRNAYVGLQNDKLGTLKLGRNTTPYFISTILFNPLVDSYVFSPTIFHTYFGAASNGVVDPGIIGDSGWNNSVLYSTPNFGGLSANLIYSAGEKAGAAGQNKWGGNLMYFNGPFAATVAYQQVRFNAVPDDLSSAGFSRQDAVLGGITYDFKVVKLFAQGQYIKTKASTAASGDIKHTNGQVGASVPIGAGNVLASYAYGKTENAIGDFKRNTFAVAYDYNLSKRTDVYAAYYYDKITGIEHGDTFGVGVRHKF
ncbi:Outer membrane porin [Cupriavidus necator H850]|jgi:predicted porin|uniref:porin n=1 Tax=Cupriavidus TaxID=106589 RepID=UPI00129E3568|nr:MULTISPECIES: porin [Cupriavidus]KAI3596180.1 Outer membrane porin [Cupriavidus necator H850]QUN29309.1 porin [Cupriavidus sp. KK10]